VFVVPFAQPGVYTVVAQIDGVEVGRLTVRVPQIDLVAPIACHINYQRIKDINAVDHGASVAFVSNDTSLLQVGVQSSLNAGHRLVLRPLQSGDLALQARLGENGPVISQCPVDDFTLRTTAEKFISMIDILPDGKQVLEAKLIMSPLIRDVDVRLSVYTSGITFEDSSLEYWISSEEFTEIGTDGFSLYRIIRTPSAAACHSMDAFQANIQVMDK
jgi:hypothetical protein